MKRINRLWQITLAVITLCSFLSVASTTDTPVADHKNAADRGGLQAQYVGVDTCKSCHEDLFKNFERTAHIEAGTKAEHGCESCHGPGSLHVEGGGDPAQIIRFSQLSRGESSARCLSCHAQKEGQSHFKSSAHSRNEVGCLDCHSPHHAKEARRLLVEDQPKLCYSCHSAVRAEFAKPFRHRVNEGLVQCSDCHDLHGSGTLREARTAPGGEPVCYKCHSEKQGPFVFEHLPVKTEGCGSCHTPHGSSNPRFLRVSQVNLLCLQCHTTPVQGPSGPAHNLSQKYQACTTCHTNIHGSNASNVFFK